MAVLVSPGVYSRERDFSLYVPALSTAIFGVVGTASKGPVDEITLITDEASLFKTFGPPSGIHYGLYAAIRYLRHGRQLKYVRVGTYDLTASGTVTGAPTGGGAGGAACTVSAATTGTNGNNLVVRVAASTYWANAFRIMILDGTTVVEVYDRCLTGAANAASAHFWITKINATSEYVVLSAVDNANDVLDAPVGGFTLAGGADGAPANDGDYVGSIGSPPTVAATGLQCFANGEVVDVNLIACPGNSNEGVISAMITLCETRGDCMCIIDPPQNLSVEDVVDWHNGLSALGGAPATPLNSSYAALIWPWVEVFDSWADSGRGANVWIPPSGHLAGVIALTDQVSEPWFAPAGLRRGHLSDVLDVEHSASQGERDYLYGDGNAVNPIVNFAIDGATIWGQRTLQRLTTVLDRINVRRLILHMRKVVATAVRSLVFEPNDEFTWRAFVRLIEPFCNSIRGAGGLYGFRVICDSTTNTPLVISRNEMAGKILIQPTKTAEIIVIDFVLLPTGASFEEFTEI